MSNTLVILNPAARNERAQRKRAQETVAALGPSLKGEVVFQVSFRPLPLSFTDHVELPGGAKFEFEGPVTEAVLLGNVALRTGKKLYWDGPNMKVLNPTEAQQYVSCEYRPGFSQ